MIFLTKEICKGPPTAVLFDIYFFEDGDKDTCKFKLPDGTFATILMECDDNEWFLEDVVMP